eukprot:6414643-Pyramimonas_sp.AAC.1
MADFTRSCGRQEFVAKSSAPAHGGLLCAAWRRARLCQRIGHTGAAAVAEVAQVAPRRWGHLVCRPRACPGRRNNATAASAASDIFRHGGRAAVSFAV